MKKLTNVKGFSNKNQITPNIGCKSGIKKYVLNFKIPFCFIVSLLLIKQFLNSFQMLVDYLYILDFLIWRLSSILCILIVLQSLLNLTFVKELQQEMAIFDEGPANVSPFIRQVRKYNFSLLFFVYLSYSLGVTYFIDNPSISYSLGLIAFIGLILYWVQFVVYTKEYVTKSFKYDKTTFGGDKRKGSVRTMFTLSGLIHAPETKKIATLCVECTKTAVVIGSGAEIGYKLSHGGLNDVSPWRQAWLNKTFPDDKTKIWTESKAAMAMHNRAMGIPHTTIYDSFEDKIKKSFPKGK